ncbi:hydrolase activity protein [[Candida] boidinii]|nr:hydrolase activity protein [[Candida] boidinii]
MSTVPITEPKKGVVNTLVLDAGPLITQSASSLQQYASIFYTTPGVYNELKDEHSRNQLLLWSNDLKIKQPNSKSIKIISDFAKLTGDYSVLSMNDIHIIALAYELECELNNGDWRLRKFPGSKRNYVLDKEILEKTLQKDKEGDDNDSKSGNEDENNDVNSQEENPELEDEWTVIPNKKNGNNAVQVTKKGKKIVESVQEPMVDDIKEETSNENEIATEDQSESVEKSRRPRRRGGRRHRKKPQQEQETEEQPEQEINEIAEQLEVGEITEDQIQTQEQSEEIPASETANDGNEEGEEEDEDEDEEDDGEWITPENLYEEMMKDENEKVQTNNKNGQNKEEKINLKVALATGDFACQNVTLQIGLNLMNAVNGLQIKRVRNYMYRCHACFRLTPIPKDGTPKHFCPSCGGATLLRCAVSISAQTGEIIPHLKKNFEWHTKGDVYSISSPLSKNSQKRFGNKGFVHNKVNQKFDMSTILREDQKEYQKVIKQEKWQRRQNEKMMQDWVGTGDADNYISPFFTGADHVKPTSVKIGKGKFANASQKKK